MAFIGKLLVVVHSALSLGVLAWASGLIPSASIGTPQGSPQGRADRLVRQARRRRTQYNGAVDKAYTPLVGQSVSGPGPGSRTLSAA